MSAGLLSDTIGQCELSVGKRKGLWPRTVVRTPDPAPGKARLTKHNKRSFLKVLQQQGDALGQRCALSPMLSPDPSVAGFGEGSSHPQMMSRGGVLLP